MDENELVIGANGEHDIIYTRGNEPCMYVLEFCDTMEECGCWNCICELDTI